MSRTSVLTHERARQGRGGQTFYCSTVQGHVPSPCPLRHPQHGCPCAEEIAQQAAAIEFDHVDESRRPSRSEAETRAREQQRDKVVRRQAQQRSMFG